MVECVNRDRVPGFFVAAGLVKDVDVWLQALCLVLVIEGIPLFLAPDGIRRAAEQLSGLDSRVLRIIGLVAMLLGAGLLLLIRS